MISLFLVLAQIAQLFKRYALRLGLQNAFFPLSSVFFSFFFLFLNKSHKIFESSLIPMQIFSSDFKRWVGFFICLRSMSECVLRVCCSVHACIKMCVFWDRPGRRVAMTLCLYVCHYCIVGRSRTLSLIQDSLWQRNLTRLWWALSLKVNHCLWWSWQVKKSDCFSSVSVPSHPPVLVTKWIWLWLCNRNTVINSYLYECYCEWEGRLSLI